MKRILIDAVYENGVLRPKEPLPLEEKEHVQVMVFVGPSHAEQSAGVVPWTGSVEDLDHLINSTVRLWRAGGTRRKSNGSAGIGSRLTSCRRSG